MTQSLTVKRLVSWALVVMWTVVIFLTLPYAPVWRDWITDNFSGYAIPITVGVILLAIAGFTLSGIIKRRSGFRTYAFFIIIMGLYAYSLSRITILVEQVHFLEYGLLVVLIIRALRLESKDIWQYLNAILMVTFIGVIDEYMQGVLSNRVGELRDIQLNIISGLLALLWYRHCLEPIEGKANPRKALLIGLPIAGAIIFAIALFNTVHSEFGHYIEEKGKLGFFSRRTYDDLRKPPADAEDFRLDVADRMYREKYGELLNQVDNPIHSEVLVHIFRRDRYLLKLDYNTAQWENYILENYFGDYIRGTKHEWLAERADSIKSLANSSPGQPYVSPVSAHIVVAFSEKAQWTAAAILEVILVICWLMLYRKKY